MDATISASLSNSIQRFVDGILRDRPASADVFEYAETFFSCEKTESPKVAHALHALKYHIKNQTEFSQIASDLFDTLLVKPASTLTVSMKSALQLASTILYTHDCEEGILIALFSDEKEIGFHKFQSLLRATFIIADMRYA
jgi:hypothetical protein